MTHDQILSKLEHHACGHAVITGGEPMILADVADLTRKIKTLAHHITIETAGTVYQDVACDLMSISPKLSNSTPYDRENGKFAAHHEQLRYQPEVLRRLIGAYDYQLKFVISTVADANEARDIVQQIGADPQRVLLMPEGTNRDVLAERAQWLVELCKDFRYRYCPRLHVEIWGNKRGV